MSKSYSFNLLLAHGISLAKFKSQAIKENSSKERPHKAVKL